MTTRKTVIRICHGPIPFQFLPRAVHACSKVKQLIVCLKNIKKSRNILGNESALYYENRLTLMSASLVVTKAVVLVLFSAISYHQLLAPPIN